MRLSRSLCAVVAEALAGTGSHATLESLFISAGAPGDPPSLSHGSKWKEWLYRAGQDDKIESLAVLGGVLEEFMDLPPPPSTQEHEDWKIKRQRVESALEENGLRYFRFGRILPQAGVVTNGTNISIEPSPPSIARPSQVEDVLKIIVKGLRRAMHPLTHRRKGSQPLSFGNEYDVQDLLHALLRPWIMDIRPEEFTPSYAGSSTRMDFLLPAHSLVIETKIVRDRSHAKRLGDELTIDIAHYRMHPSCKRLWCVVYDPETLITNAEGLISDIQGQHSSKGRQISVHMEIL